MIINRQKAYAVDLPALRSFVRRLKRCLNLSKREFSVCLVGDREIKRLNAIYRGRERPTDVLSFPWRRNENGSGFQMARGHSKQDKESDFRRAGSGREDASVAPGEFQAYLGDVAISVETARRNARREGHSTLNEIRWLILHGALHLLGYDHERDRGEMTGLELTLRERLGISRRPTKVGLKRRTKVLHG